MDYLKKFFRYFFRDELSIRHKLVNVILGCALLVQFPGIIISIIIGTGFLGVLTQLTMAVVIFIVMYFTNKFPNSPVPPILITIVSNIIVFPIMYFLCGGYGTGIVLWMLFGAIFTWFLVDT